MEHRLVQIRGSISQLDKFTRGSVAVAPKYPARQQGKNPRKWVQFRDLAKRLFESLGSHWACACLQSHRASLRLDIDQMSSIHEENEVKFNVLFSNDTRTPTTGSVSTSWNWLQVDIQPLPHASKQCVKTIY